MSDVRLFKLITGEDFVGVIKDQDQNNIHIENPCLLGLAMAANGKPGLNMQPMLMFSEDKSVKISRDFIIYIAGVDINIQNKYNEIFGAGIVVAKNNLIV
jgi:hypothetical protein